MKKPKPLSETNPNLISEWDFEKNAPLTPANVSKGQVKKVWWKCPNGHSYAARIDHRCNMKTGCPYCSNKAALIGENDFATVYPEIAAEWDYEKNEKPPEEFLPFSTKPAFWICPLCRQSYKRTIQERTYKGTACPSCTAERHTSRQEQTIHYYLSKVTCTESRAILYGKEVDIYLPIYRTGVEYNGEYYHSNKKTHDERKREILTNHGINLITISCGRERSTRSGDIVLLTSPMANPNDDELTWGIQELFRQLSFDCPNIDLRRDMADIYAQYIKSIKDNSVATRYSELSAEWDYEKNKNLKPESFSFGSNKKVWWKCPTCKSSYDMSIANRTIGKSSCPYCAGKRIRVGLNDLATSHPNLAKEWDYTKNTKSPQQYSKGSDFKANWICSICGYHWTATISSRTQGSGCPACANKIIIPGRNDFATLNPSGATLWNYAKNSEQKPEDFAPNSNKTFWWCCNICGHEWKASINAISHGRRCPECAKKSRPITRQKTYLQKNGSLAERFPELLDYWDYENNTGISPYEVTAGTRLKAHWKCPACAHQWNASIASVAQGRRCPKCGRAQQIATRKKTYLKKRGSFAERFPDLIKEWDFSKNIDISPLEISAGSHFKAHWICSVCKHQWCAPIYSRTSGTGCPKCAGKVK